MNTKYALSVAILLLTISGFAGAEIIWDSGHREYSAGRETWVYMYNDASVDITGGWIDELYLYDDTTAKVTGGEVMLFMVEGNSSADFYNDSVVGMLRPNDNATATVYGGEFNSLFALGNSTVNVYGGTYEIGIRVHGSPLINMYVEEYTWNPDGGSSKNFGLLTGIWFESGEPFYIDYVDFDAIDYMVFVPEPSMLLLLGIGGLMLRHKQ
jgi:hypothetical protein